MNNGPSVNHEEIARGSGVSVDPNLARAFGVNTKNKIRLNMIR